MTKYRDERTRPPEGRSKPPPVPGPLLEPDEAKRPVFVLSERYDRLSGGWHRHRRAQLIHASEGVLTVHTREGVWVVPPQRAVWIPPGVLHRVVSKKRFWLRTLYLEPGVAPVPSRCRVVSVSSLAAELLVAVSELGPDYPLRGPEERLVRVLLDQLPLLAVAPMHLPHPRDERLARLCEVLTEDPADARPLGPLAAAFGLTERTAARLCVRETGLTFGKWRQQLRLLAAIEHLAAGASVTTAALEVGYSDVSSFIAGFKAALGVTPARYFRQSK